MKIQGLIFDMDGVLFDSERACMDNLHEVFDEFSVPWQDDFYYQIIGTTRPFADNLFESLYHDRELFTQIRAIADPRYLQKIRQGAIPLKKGARELLEYLEHCPLPSALASGSGHDRIAAQFGAKALPFPFRVCVSGQDVSRCKPDPEIFVTAADRLGVPLAACLVIEDSYNGIRAAAAGQAMSVMVPDLVQPNEEICKLFDYRCEDLFEVITLIETLIRS